MRAIAVGAFRADPALVEMAKPEPEAGEVRVRIEYAALNPSDWQTAQGAPDDGPAPRVFPMVVGVDFAGRVDMIGSGENRFRVGDPVFGRVSRPNAAGGGTYCDYVSVPQDSAITVVPPGLPCGPRPRFPPPGWRPPRSWRSRRSAATRACWSSVRRAASAAI